MRQITIFSPNNVRILDLAVVTELFGHAQTAQGPAYTMSICSEYDEVAAGEGHVAIRTARRLDAFISAHTVIVLGSTTPLVPPSTPVQNAIRDAAARGARIAALSTGAFTLGASGVLVGRRATTASDFQARFKDRFPDTHLIRDPLVDDAPFFTSGDYPFSARLGLDLITQDCGKQTADQVRSRFFERPVRFRSDAGAAPPPQSKLVGLQHWARENLSGGLALEQLIAQSGMTARTLSRQFQVELHMSPIQWLRSEQIRAARRLLEDANVPLDDVWQRSGFDRPRTFRTQFKLAVGVSPGAYRSHKQAER